MLSHKIFLSAVLAVFAYMAAFAWTWHRAEKLRRVPGTRDALPSPAGFFTGAAFLWLWGDQHLGLKDRQLSLAVRLARACFAAAILLWTGSIFLDR